VKALSRRLRLSLNIIPALLLAFWTAGQAQASPFYSHPLWLIAGQPHFRDRLGIFLPLQQVEGEDPEADRQALSGVNLEPAVRKFRVEMAVFSESSRDVQDGCVTPGEHRLLRFDLLMQNTGDQDLVVGAPADRPELFVWSAGHNHYHLTDFVEYRLLDAGGFPVTENYKQAICFFDSLRIADWARGDRQFDPGRCNEDQGLSAGWADLYRASISCQFIVIDDIPDGGYSLTATANPRLLLPEASYLDNMTCTGLQFEGDRVTVTESDLCRSWEVLLTHPDKRSPEESDLCRSDGNACWE